MAGKAKPRAALYVRVSQDRTGESTATDRQERDCRALCRREGFDVAEVYVDRDSSAYGNGSRPAFDRLMGELDRYDVLVAWKVDRLVRRVNGFFRVLEAAEGAGVRLVCVLDSLDTSSPMGKGVAGIIAAMGEQESANIGTRVARKHEESAAAGRPHGHRRSFGYTPTMDIIPSEARAIRRARDKILAGASMSSICAQWNAGDVKPTTAPAWRVSTFKRMICGPHLAGMRVHRGEVVGVGNWPAIIGREDHERIVARLGDPRIRSRGRPASYLLTGIVRCGRCGAVLRASVSHGRRVWACRRVPGDESHCGRLHVQAEPAEDLVAEAVLAALHGPRLTRAMQRKPKRSAPDENIADLEVRLVQLGIDHDAGLISRREWLARRGPFVERIEHATAALGVEDGTQALATLKHGRGGIRARWEALDVPGRREIVAAVVEAVVVDPANGSGDVADRVSITWRV